jgi:hypothetical protein
MSPPRSATSARNSSIAVSTAARVLVRSSSGRAKLSVCPRMWMAAALRSSSSTLSRLSGPTDASASPVWARTERASRADFTTSSDVTTTSAARGTAKAPASFMRIGTRRTAALRWCGGCCRCPRMADSRRNGAGVC